MDDTWFQCTINSADPALIRHGSTFDGVFLFLGSALAPALSDHAEESTDRVAIACSQNALQISDAPGTLSDDPHSKERPDMATTTIDVNDATFALTP